MIAIARGQDMGNAWGGSSTESIVTAVGDDLHREMKGNRGAMGSVVTDI